MAREDQRVCNDHILASSGSKHNDFSNVIRGEWLAASASELEKLLLISNSWVSSIRIYSIGLGLVSIEPNDGEFLEKVSFATHPRAPRSIAYRLHLTGVNVDNPNSSSDKLLPQSIGEGLHGSLGGTVDTATGVRFTTSNTADVDDVTAATFVSLLEDG